MGLIGVELWPLRWLVWKLLSPCVEVVGGFQAGSVGKKIDYPAFPAAPKTVPTSIGSSIPRCMPLRYAIWPPC